MAICTIRLAQSNFHSIQAVQITSMCNSKDNLCNVSFCFSHFIKITSTPLFIGSPTCFCGRRSLHTSFCAPYMKISSLFEEQDAATTDIPFVKYPDYENLTEENIRMVIGFKSAKLLQRKDDITLRVIPARKVVSCLHRGTYNELANLYNEISE